MTKAFSNIEISVIKSTAKNIHSFVAKKVKLQEKIDELQEQIASQQSIIDSLNTPVKAITGGFGAEDLVNRETIHTGKVDPKSGKEVLQTRWTLKYPDTIIPVSETSEEAVEGTNVSEAEEETEPSLQFSENVEEEASVSETSESPIASDDEWA
jgi:hypothetical protein